MNALTQYRDCVTPDTMAASVARRPNIQEELEDRKRRLEADLERVNKALDAMKANPEVTKVLVLATEALR